MINILKNINNSLRFSLEVILVISLIYFGLKNPDRFLMKLGLGVLFPVVIVIFWAIYMAPKSLSSFAGSKRILAEIILFSSSIIAIYFTGEKNFAIGLGVFTIINTILIYII